METSLSLVFKTLQDCRITPREGWEKWCLRISPINNGATCNSSPWSMFQLFSQLWLRGERKVRFEIRNRRQNISQKNVTFDSVVYIFNWLCLVLPDWTLVFSSLFVFTAKNFVSQSSRFHKNCLLSCKYSIFLSFLWHYDILLPFKNVSRRDRCCPGRHSIIH